MDYRIVQLVTSVSNTSVLFYKLKLLWDDEDQSST